MSTATPSSCTALTGLPYLWLVPVSTIFIVEGLHHQKHIAAGLAPCHPTASIIYIYIYIYNIYIYIIMSMGWIIA